MASIAGGTDIINTTRRNRVINLCDKPHMTPAPCQVDTPITLRMLRNRYNSPDSCDV
jgi:hypothetical protein